MRSAAAAAARLLFHTGRPSGGWAAAAATGSALPFKALPPSLRLSPLAQFFASSASASAPPRAKKSENDDEPLHEHLGGLELIDVDVDRAAGIATLRLNRPSALNALSSAACEEVVDAALRLDADRGVRALVVTGAPPPAPSPASSSSSSSPPPRRQQQHQQHQQQAREGKGGEEAGKEGRPGPPPRPRRRPVFAAGADIREMSALGAKEAREGRLYQGWRRLAAVRAPLVAAVNGVALGGGFELAMMCDVIIASEDAEFGLPEPTLGVIPLMGGTQRLARLAGRAVAMDVALTGRRLTAREALRWGVVSRVVPLDAALGEEAVVREAQAAARAAASLPARSVESAKRAVAFAADGGGDLEAGLDLEERLFHGCFATRDREEGMAAFLGRRAPKWRHS